MNHFYGTLTGQSAPQSLIEQYGSLIDNGSLSPVSLAMQVAENELNLQNIDLVGLAPQALNTPNVRGKDAASALDENYSHLNAV